MRAFHFLLLLIATLLLAASAGAAACGGGDGSELTLEEYFSQLQNLTDVAEEQFDQISSELDDELASATSPDDELKAARTSLPQFLAVLTDFSSSLKSLEPPTRAEDAHEEYLESVGQQVDAFEDLVEEVERAESAEELAEVRARLEGYVPLLGAERLRQPCLALQHIADESRIDVLLPCLLFTMGGGSMEPGISYGARLTASEYRDRAPARGDVIVFKAPHQPPGQPERVLIKRVIGEPGETVEVRDRTVFIDGQPLDEPYIQDAPAYTFGPETVPAGHYFVLGDNRNNSSDSHVPSVGMVPKENIIGRVVE